MLIVYCEQSKKGIAAYDDSLKEEAEQHREMHEFGWKHKTVIIHKDRWITT
jgi:hypothetical protein